MEVSFCSAPLDKSSIKFNEGQSLIWELAIINHSFDLVILKSGHNMRHLKSSSLQVFKSSHTLGSFSSFTRP